MNTGAVFYKINTVTKIDETPFTEDDIKFLVQNNLVDKEPKLFCRGNKQSLILEDIDEYPDLAYYGYEYKTFSQVAVGARIVK